MRPRERLVARGASSLSDDELVALLIAGGTTQKSVLVRANELLRRLGGMRALGRSEAVRLRSLGLGQVSAIRLAAACEIGRRVVIAGASGERCDTPELAAAALAPQFTHLEREQLIVALLSRKHRLLECVTPLYLGSVSGTPVRIAELFTEAIKRQAPAILMAHDHPSGDPTPSAEDIRTTREAARAAGILGIELVDHLVFGAGRWVSLRRIGALS